MAKAKEETTEEVVEPQEVQEEETVATPEHLQGDELPSKDVADSIEEAKAEAVANHRAEHAND